MPRCLAPGCGQFQFEDFAFCPTCGFDNRPPEARGVAVENCEHRFLVDKPRCLLCGQLPGETPVRPRRRRMTYGELERRLCAGVLISGIVLLAYGLYAIAMGKLKYGWPEGLHAQLHAPRQDLQQLYGLNTNIPTPLMLSDIEGGRVGFGAIALGWLLVVLGAQLMGFIDIRGEEETGNPGDDWKGLILLPCLYFLALWAGWWPQRPFISHYVDRPYEPAPRVPPGSRTTGQMPESRWEPRSAGTTSHPQTNDVGVRPAAPSYPNPAFDLGATPPGR